MSQSPRPDYFTLAANLARARARAGQPVTPPGQPIPSMYVTYTDEVTGLRVTVHAVSEGQLADIQRRRRKEPEPPRDSVESQVYIDGGWDALRAHRAGKL